MDEANRSGDAQVDEANRGGVDEGRRRLVTWLWRLPVLAAIGGGGYGAYEAVRVHFLKRAAGAAPEFQPRPETPVARLDAFTEPWAAVAFELAGDPAVPTPNGANGAGAAAQQVPGVPAVAVRLPGPIVGGLDVDSGVGAATMHLAAFSRICTHQQCIVSLNRDLEAIAFGFNHTVDHPALTCPCHLSVFDPLRAGEAVSGPAVDPLPRVRLELQGTAVVATGIETG
ncbi:MAG: Rieske 2Fe-2S domain-containing protein [Trueperaceae bacterium]